MEKTYYTNKSTVILLMYWLILAFLVFMVGGMPFFMADEMSGGKLITFEVVFVIILFWFIRILYQVYHMNYVINNGRLIINGAFNKNTIHIQTIEEIKKSAIPFGVRLFGGSFIGGRYYLPGIGKAWIAMTNFKDGVLIRTRDQENYIITPQNPEDFVKNINNLRSK